MLAKLVTQSLIGIALLVPFVLTCTVRRGEACKKRKDSDIRSIAGVVKWTLACGFAVIGIIMIYDVAARLL